MSGIKNVLPPVNSQYIIFLQISNEPYIVKYSCEDKATKSLRAFALEGSLTVYSVQDPLLLQDYTKSDIWIN